MSIHGAFNKLNVRMCVYRWRRTHTSLWRTFRRKWKRRTTWWLTFDTTFAKLKYCSTSWAASSSSPALQLTHSLSTTTPQVSKERELREMRDKFTSEIDQKDNAFSSTERELRLRLSSAEEELQVLYVCCLAADTGRRFVEPKQTPCV